MVVPRLGFAYQLTPSTVIRGGGGKFIIPSTVRFPDGPTGHGINQRVNNMQPSVDNNRTFIADLTNPFPNGVENYPGRSDNFQQVLLGGGANQFIYDPDGYPGSAYQWNIAVQHQFGSDFSVEATYTGLDGNHLPNTLNYNQLGLEHINRAANDTSVCSLTEQRHHPVRRGGLRLEPARHLLRRLPAPAGAQSLRRPDSRRVAVHGHRPARAAPAAVPAVSVGQPAGLRRQEPLQRPAAARRQALRCRQHHQRQLHLLAEHDQRRDGDQLARVRRRESDGGLPDQRSRHGILAQRLRRPAPSGAQLRPRPAVRPGPSLLRRHQRVRRRARQRLERQRRDHSPGRLAAGASPPRRTSSGSATACARTSSTAATRASRGRRKNGSTSGSTPPAIPCRTPRSSPPTRRATRGCAGLSAMRSASIPMCAPTASTTGTSPSRSRRAWPARVNLTLRAEAFNLFNRVQFGPPNTTASTAATANFGQVTTQANQPRLLQIAARLAF